MAQNPFPYSESFTRSSANTPDLVLGGGQGSSSALLTGGNIDTEGAGYLRLTSNVLNQAGFARSQKSFPSVNGIDISFNFYIYGGQIGSADGIAFFLFDSDVVNRTKAKTDELGLNYPIGGFNIGAFGGALGYAQRNVQPGPQFEDALDLPGVSQGYLGIGLDEYGKFSQPTNQDGEGRQEGPGIRASSVVLRGKGDGARFLGAANYIFITHTQTTDAPSMAGIGNGTTFVLPGLVDGRTGGGITSSNAGFRRAKITLTPILPQGYNIKVVIIVGGAPPISYEVININYNQAAPTNVSFGFAGSTGSENNFHEIQNIELVVPSSVPLIPVLADISKTGLEDAYTNFTISDFTAGFPDPNGINTLTQIQVKSLPANGTLYLGTVIPDNIVILDQVIVKADLVNLKFVPTANWNGSTSFDWNGRDDTQYATQFEQVNLTITPVNDLPLTADKTVAGVVNTNYTFLSGDFAFSDPIDATNGTQGTHAISGVKVVAIPPLGALKLNGVDVINGQTIPLANIAGGQFTYVPVASGSGTPYATFTFQVQDNGTTANSGVDLSLQKTLSINIGIVPTITLNSSNADKCIGTTAASLPYSATTGTPNQYSIVFAGPALTAGFVNVTNATLPASPITIVVPGAAAAAVYNATLTVRNSSSLSSSIGIPITITIRSLPAVAAITGTLSACEGGSAGSTTQLSNTTTGGSWSSSNIAVATVNSAGLLTGVTAGTVTITYTTAANVNGCTNSATATVIVNAKPAVAAITGTLSVCEGGSAGSTTQLSNTTTGGSWSSSNIAVATVNSAGLLTGVTAGTVTITYTTAANVNGCTNSATATVTVNAKPAVAAISGASGTSVGLTTTLASLTTGGVWSSNTTAVATVSSTGIVTGVSVGTAVITYTVTGGGCTNSDAKSMTITAAPTNNIPPIIADISKTGTKDTPVLFTSLDFTEKFTDTDPLVKVTIVSLSASGTLKVSGVNVTAGQQISLADLSKITFVPATGYTGGPVSFQWNGSDGTNYAATPKNVNITINAVNTAPVAVNDAYTTTRGGTLTVALPGVLTNDTDANGNPITAIKVTDPPNGTVTLNANGSFVYSHNGGSSNSDVFTYKVNDGLIDGNTVSVIITISTGNGPPVVTDLQKIGTGFTPITFTSEDFRSKYTDPNSDPLIKIIVTALPPLGTLKLNGVAVGGGQEIPVASLGNLTFEPPVNWSGTTVFGWNGFDGTVYATNPANVSIQVLLTGDPSAKIGLAKSLGSVAPAPNGTYDVKFVFTAVNYGINTLENVSIKDNLLIAFGGATVSVKSIVGFGNLKANTSFNGSSDTELLLTTSKLSPAEQARIELVVNVKLGLSGGLFQNTATAQGTSSVNGVKVTDISTNGLKPDPSTVNDVSPSVVTPIQLDSQPSFVPQGFSPNGDGQNDKFVIQNAQGKLVSLEIYNRWGNRVYKSADYKNDWGGEVTEGFFLGRDIPDGTYYYIIIIENKDKFAGFITINR